MASEPLGPRLWFTGADIPELRRRSACDERGTLGVSGRQLWTKIRMRAEAFARREWTATYGELYGTPLPDAPEPPSHPESPQWPYWTGIASELANHLELCAAMCVVEPEKRWEERLRRLTLGVCSWRSWTDPDFQNGRYRVCLDTGFLTLAVAMVYDWCSNVFSPQERALIAAALVEKGLDPLAREASRPGGYVAELSWVNGSGHALAALGIGALALHGVEPRARQWVELATRKLRAWFDRHIHAGGALAEQMGYGGWMADLFALYCSAVHRLMGIDLAAEGRFREILDYGLALLTPDGAFAVNFGDDGDLDGAPPSLQLYARYWAAERGDSRAQWYLARSGADRIKRVVNPRVRADISISALMRLVWHRVDVPAKAPSKERTTFLFPDVGIATVRTGWRAEDSLLAVRSGKPLPHGHRDAGSFMLYSRGEWLVWDPGYAVFDMAFPPGLVAGDPGALHLYTASNLGHSTLVVDGKPCATGEEPPPPQLEKTESLSALLAPFGLDVKPRGPVVRVDAGPAYRGQLERFVRRFCLLAPDALVIVDEVAPASGVRRLEWRIRSRSQGRWQQWRPDTGEERSGVWAERWVWRGASQRLRVCFAVREGMHRLPVCGSAASIPASPEYGEHLGLSVKWAGEYGPARRSTNRPEPRRLVALTLLEWRAFGRDCGKDIESVAP